MKLPCLLALAALLPAGFVSAQADSPGRHGQLRSEDIPATAKWFFHVDLESLKGGKIGRELLSGLDGKAKRNIRQFQRMISFNPLEDLDSVTISGSGPEPDQAVAVLHGVFDVQRLNELALDAEEYVAHQHAGNKIHSWADAKTPGGRTYGSVLGPDKMIIGPHLPSVKAVLAVAAGQAASMPPVEFLTGLQKGAFVSASADLSILDALDIESRFVRSVRQLHIVAGEADGKVFARAAIDAEDERVPVLLARMLVGVLAFAEAAEQLPTDTAEAISIEASGSRVVMEGAMDLDSFLELAKTLEQAKKEGL